MARKPTSTDPDPKSTSPKSAASELFGESDAPAGAIEAGSYVVLARKYRPETFGELIGQDAMVQTLTNAFATDRIAQAYMLTGVRGVGKTTTARILARALNYSRPGLPDRPSVEMHGYGEHCLQIIQSRHPDVIEMDAASNTGVDNVREIIENTRYRPILARYKVFIVDEVHMLSKSAFNALLKTLEEPPAHVKFIFATTEVRKVPVTVLSRCQRFDLRRVESPLLVNHFRSILARENAAADDEALALIARAAGGSVRDGLSLLDQAIAMGAGNVSAAGVRAMLGLADRGRIFDLVDSLLAGAAGDALRQLEHLHRDGADPLQILADLAEAIHAATRAKVIGAEGAGDDLSGEDRRRAAALAQRSSLPVLTRAWQMLQKGLEEAARAPSPLQAAEMVLIRIAHAAELPSPDDLMRMLGGNGQRRPQDAAGQRPSPGGTQTARLHSHADPQGLREAPSSVPEPPLEEPGSLAAVARLAGHHRDARLKVHLEEHVSLVRFEPGRIEINLLDGAPAGLAGELGEKLGRWTGRRWIVAVSREPGAPPIAVVRRQQAAAEIADIKTHPAVQTLLEVFPEAEIKEVRPLPGPQDESATG